MPTPRRDAVTAISTSRVALAGFLVSGLLLSFPGAILPAWGYHVRPSYSFIGNCFLAVNAGLLVSVFIAARLLKRKGIRFVVALAYVIAFGTLISLSFTSPPVAEFWRLPGLTGVGFASGLLNTAIFHAISPAYRHDPAATVNLAGSFFGFGSFAVVLLIAVTFNYYTVSAILIFIAVIPALFLSTCLKEGLSGEIPLRRRSIREVALEFTLPSAILFSLLLFCQFGNEWAIAGWLPLFLIERLGVSPTVALIMLMVYWLALVIGRLTVQAILPYVHHGKLLLASSMGAMFGCVILTFTNNRFGAVAGILLLGSGFAPVYPMVVERIGKRFPHYHPGFFNGIFSIALTGGMLAPATLGYAGEYFGVRVMTALPMLGTAIVLLLVVAIWVEDRLSGPGVTKPERGPG